MISLKQHTSRSEESSVRRSLRRKIPYVESFEEQISRELWEKHPFSGTEHVVDTIIGSGSGDLETILNPIEIEPECISSLSGYEDSFDLLYKPIEKDAHYVRNTVIGIADIVDSPFANIVDNHETQKQKQNNFCLRVAYKGDDFCGWQTQLDNTEQPSVQRTLEEWLTELQNDQSFNAEANAEEKRVKRAEKRERKRETNATCDSIRHEVKTRTHSGKSKKSQKLRWADLPVAGRTDSGVSAIGQLCRFRTYRKDLTPDDIAKFLGTKLQKNPTISNSLRVTQVTPVTKAFHPTFTTSCRAYVYLIDVDDAIEKSAYGLFENDGAEDQVVLLDAMLRSLEGKELDYVGLSYGRVKTQNTLCTLYHARAKLVEYQSGKRAICIELVGDRFLRRMVRLLVEAAVRLVATESRADTANNFALLRVIQKQDRTLIGRPAPPSGLIFVNARVQSET